MPSATVFISHCSHSEQEKAFLATFRAALEQPRDGLELQTLVDPNLQPGAPWNPQLNEWMAECHAAIVLMTPQALESQWVFKETSMLVWRACLDEGFLLIPVRLPGVDERGLKGDRFAPLFLDTIQWVTAHDAETASEAAARALAPLRDRIAGMETPLDRLTMALAARFRRSDRAALEHVARGLAARRAWTPAGGGWAVEYAELVARHLLSDEPSPLGDLPSVISDLLNLGTMSLEDAHGVVRILAPLWVSHEAAARLLGVSVRADRCAAALNGRLVARFSAEMYLLRAFPVDERWTHVTIAANADDAPSVERLSQRIRDQFREDEDLEDWTDDEVDDHISGVPNCFVVLAAPHPDSEVLAGLHARFPTVTFILETAETMPDTLPELAVAVQPELDVNVERAAWSQYTQAKRMLKRRRR